MIENLKELLEPIVTYRTSRSSGAGGQAVNKVETRVEVICLLSDLDFLTPKQMNTLRDRLKNRITQKDEIIVVASDSRSQLQNKTLAIKRLAIILNSALEETAERLPTKPSKSARLKRLETKAKRSETKARRRWRPD